MNEEAKKYQEIVFQICRDMDEGCEAARPCCVEDVVEYTKEAIKIARQNGLAQIIGLLKPKEPHPCNYINLRQAEIEKQLRLAETIRQAHSPDCQEQPSELVAELRDWVEYRADTHEEKAILNKAADRIEELTKKVLFERSWGKQYYEKCNRLNERVAQLEAFALKLVDGDRDELLNLDYWAEEYLHAYNQLCGVNEMQNKIEQLEAEIKELKDKQ